ncbi:MAG: sulfatase-like hydrolase/transferase, partial [Cytophagales bacterium]|nr:sulfatase-like hydrolase/transferase [Cytophagales bacterium]
QIQIFLPHRPFKQDESRPVNPDSVDIPPYYPDHPVTRKDWALYLETIQHVDRAFGKVMERLREDGVLENTVIFFVGDQGRPHLRAKQFLYDAGTHTPLMVRWPDGRGAGTVSGALVSNIDLSTASLVLAGIEVPSHIHGVNFLDEATERAYVFTAKDRMDGTVDRQRALRNQDFKYIKNYYPGRVYAQFNTYKKTSYPVLTLMEVMKEKGQLDEAQLPFMAATRPGEELYDLKNDPYELNNLADDEDYGEVLSAMRNTLAGYVEKYDKGQYPENEEELTRARETMMKAYERKMKRMGLDTGVSNQAYLEYWETELLKKETD